MLKFNASLASARLAAANKKTRSQTIVDALGPTRRLRIFHDANGGADPFATGTEIYNVGLTGPMAVVGGDIAGFGTAGGVTVRVNGRDLATGTACLRVEGNGNWIQGTLGLAGSATANRDFVLPVNITQSTSVTFDRNAKVRAPLLMSSGTGPVVPALVNSRPHTVEIWDWSDQANPTLAGSITFNNRIEDFVYEDADLAASTGDVAIIQSTQSVMLDVHEFGATLMVSNPSNTEVGNVPLYQVLVGCKYSGPGWTNYPFSALSVGGTSTYDFKNHATHPKPFKAVLKDVDGNVLHTWQLRDGKPINDPSLVPAIWDSTHAVRPLFTCAMMLPWQNTRPRLSNKAAMYYPGITAVGTRPSAGKCYLSTRLTEPLITGGYRDFRKEGAGNIFAMPQWPQPQVNYTGPGGDDYLQIFNEFNRSGGIAQWGPWATGWGYEPGSYSGHNWYTGPGGPRPDRAFIPSQLAIWAHNPAGIRPHENTPWRDIADGFLLGYFNHSNHFMTDVKTMTLAPQASLLKCDLNFRLRYYTVTIEPTGPTTITLNACQKDGTDPVEHFDNFGHMPWNGWGRDELHGYTNAGWGALLLNSPMHAIGSKWDTITQMMHHADIANRNVEAMYMVRDQAWLWLNMTIAWKLGSQHPLGFTRQQIEDRMVAHLERIYQDIYLPLKVGNSQRRYFQGLRNLGVPANEDPSQQATQGGALGFYMAGVLALMRQTGFWSVLYAKGGHVKTVLDMQIENMDKYCFDLFCDTKLWMDWQDYQPLEHTDPVPASWSAWSAQHEPDPVKTLTKNPDGSYRNQNIYLGTWLYFQYVYIRRDYFPEFANPRLTAAIAKADAYEQDILNAINAQADPWDKTRMDAVYRIPALAPLKAPAAGQLGPA